VAFGRNGAGRGVDWRTPQPRAERRTSTKSREPPAPDLDRPDPVRAGPARRGHRVRAAPGWPQAGRRPRGAHFGSWRHVLHARGPGPVLQPAAPGLDVPAALPPRSPPARHGAGLRARRGKRSPDCPQTGIVSGFCRQWCWLPRTGSTCSCPPTPEGSLAAARRRPSRWRCSAARSASPARRSAPASRRGPRSGATCAAGMAPIPARSPTCSPGRCSAPGSRSPCTAAT